jgi:hypothetical protein
VAIERAGSDARLFGDVVQAGVGSEARKRFLGNFDDALAVSLGIHTGLAARLCRGRW